ncbi:hypothetical protein KY495_07675 [Massilia sp. PAMC28688]|uniref:hypothetical protein n=1 Tax=Massilia sp. PAMC28688 TaxID=2861283 RepID=UPI001C631188|nr:hypothetical protein [Massilia sp. PAMC28688]QYF95031.1 hypothetical protein KY495_07675 [Massilia sp. PAMC28688]
MMRSVTLGAAALTLALAVSGCAATSPAFEGSFGQTVRTSLASQVINPAAAASTNPVAGIDAQAAMGAQRQYEKSFAQPQMHQPAMLSGSGR